MEVFIVILFFIVPFLSNKIKFNDKPVVSVLSLIFYTFISLVFFQPDYTETFRNVDIYPITLNGVNTDKDHYINENMEIVINYGVEQTAIVPDEIVYGSESYISYIEYVFDDDKFPYKFFLSLDLAPKTVLHLKKIE